MIRVQCDNCMWELSAGTGVGETDEFRDTELNIESWLKQPQAFQAEGAWKQGRALSI